LVITSTIFKNLVLPNKGKPFKNLVLQYIPRPVKTQNLFWRFRGAPVCFPSLLALNWLELVIQN